MSGSDSVLQYCPVYLGQKEIFSRKSYPNSYAAARAAQTNYVSKTNKQIQNTSRQLGMMMHTFNYSLTEAKATKEIIAGLRTVSGSRKEKAGRQAGWLAGWLAD